VVQVSVDQDSQQTILRGMGELQIEVIKDRLRTDFGLDVFLGPIQINYKVVLLFFGVKKCKYYHKNYHFQETVTEKSTPVTDRHEISEVLANRAQRVALGLRVEPAKGAGKLKRISIDYAIHEHYGHLVHIPEHFKEAIRDGCISACYRGPVLGYPIQVTMWCFKHALLLLSFVNSFISYFISNTYNTFKVKFSVLKG